MSNLKREIETAINRASAENGSDTPDYILAHFLTNCLASFEVAVRDRDRWHGFETWPTHVAAAPTDDAACAAGTEDN